MLKNFRAFQLAKEFYQRCKKLKAPLLIQDQLLRASLSIALNLAESSGNRTEKERVRFFSIALGSLRECQAIIELENIQDAVLHDLSSQLGAVLFKLCRIKRAEKSVKGSLSLQPDLQSDLQSVLRTET